MDYFPTNDIVFKMLFVDDANQELLKSLLSATLKINKADIQGLEIQNPEITPENVKDKFCRLDINVKMNNSLVNIEMQVANQEHFEERILYYLSKLYISPLKRGHKYSKLKQSISLAFIDFKLYKHKDYHSAFELFDREHRTTFTNKFELHIYELKKLSKELTASTDELLWLQFLNAKTDKEIEMLAQSQNQDIVTATKALRHINATPNKRALAEYRRETKIEEKSALHSAKMQERNRIINAMRVQGYTEEQIENLVKMLPNDD
jgi:predicted transposase/invertase (TIGR01784 family)